MCVDETRTNELAPLESEDFRFTLDGRSSLAEYDCIDRVWGNVLN